MSLHKKLDKKGNVTEIVATNEDAVLANAAPALLKACESAFFVADNLDSLNVNHSLRNLYPKFKAAITGARKE